MPTVKPDCRPPSAPEKSPTVVGPAEQPRSPASAISAYMAVPAPGSASAASENMPGQKMPTEKPHSAQPSSAASALPLCDATM